MQWFIIVNKYIFISERQRDFIEIMFFILLVSRLSCVIAQRGEWINSLKIMILDGDETKIMRLEGSETQKDKYHILTWLHV